MKKLLKIGALLGLTNLICSKSQKKEEMNVELMQNDVGMNDCKSYTSTINDDVNKHDVDDIDNLERLIMAAYFPDPNKRVIIHFDHNDIETKKKVKKDEYCENLSENCENLQNVYEEYMKQYRKMMELKQHQAENIKKIQQYQFGNIKLNNEEKKPLGSEINNNSKEMDEIKNKKKLTYNCMSDCIKSNDNSLDKEQKQYEKDANELNYYGKKEYPNGDLYEICKKLINTDSKLLTDKQKFIKFLAEKLDEKYKILSNSVSKYNKDIKNFNKIEELEK